MVVYKKYGIKVYRRFWHTKFNSNFGVDKNKYINIVYNVIKNKPGSLVAKYGITLEQYKKEYVPILNKHLGGYVMFLGIAADEGGGWTHTWINNKPATSSDPKQQMLTDIGYIKAGLNTYAHPPARSAPEVLSGTQYVPDNPGQDTRELRKCGKNTVGRYYIPFTMAGNAWVFATKWCVANQGPQPGVYFGNPYDHIIDWIKQAGGKINGAGGNDAQTSPGGQTPAQSAADLAQNIIREIQRALRFDIHNIAMTNYYENAFISAERTYNNTYKIRFRHDFIENIVKNAQENTDDKDPDNNKSDDFNDSSLNAGKWWFPVKGKGGISDPWGYRAWRVQAGQPPSGFHDGMDIGAAAQIPGHKVYACHSGTIVYSGYHSAALLWLVILKTGKYYVWYQEFTASGANIAVKVGQKVKAKQLIGNVTGTHLHIGITKQKDMNQALASWDKNNGTWLNPKKFFWNKRW